MGGSSGGGTAIDMRYFPNELEKGIKPGYAFQTENLGQFRSGDPFLSAAGPQVLNWLSQVPGAQSQFQDFGNQLQGDQRQLGGLFSQLGGFSSNLGTNARQLGTLSSNVGALAGPVTNRFNTLYNQLGGQADTLSGWLARPSATIASGGALSAEGERDVFQRSMGNAALQGSTRTSGALGTSLLNREAEQERRYNLALQQGQGLEQQLAGIRGQQGQTAGQETSLLSGLYGQQANIVGQQAGIRGQQAGIAQAQGANLGQQANLTGQRANLLGQAQSYGTNALNNVLNVANTGVNQAATLFNPILQYVSSLFGGNQQAQVAQAGINAGQENAQSAKTGQILSSAISSIGSVAGMAAGASDERLKTMIRETGLKTAEGIPLKVWEYKTKPGVKYLSAVAQDIEEKVPSAVFTDPLSDLKFIDTKRFPIMRVSALEKEVA